jgi:hypothetical protein
MHYLNNVVAKVMRVFEEHFGDKTQEVVDAMSRKSPHYDQETAEQIEAIIGRELTYFDKCFLDNYRSAIRYLGFAKIRFNSTLASYKGREEKKNGR